MRICLNAGFFREVGTYWTAYFLARELANRRHDVTLLCISGRNRFRSQESVLDGVKVIECPRLLNRPLVLHGMGPLDMVRRLRDLGTQRYDIVHGFEYYPDVTLSVWLSRWFRSYVYVSDWRDWFSKGLGYGRFAKVPGAARFMGWIEDVARRGASGITVGSRELERHARDLGFAADQVLLLHGAAPLDTVRPMPQSQARHNVGLGGKRMKIIGFLSSTHSVGLDSFVEPIVGLFDEMPELRFMMIGNPDQRFLREMARAGKAERIITTGWVSDDRLPSYLGAADLFILPLNPDIAEASRWPLKVGDYLAAGRPVVGSAVGDTWRILEEYEAGLVVDSDAGTISSALRRLLTDKVEAEAMGARARKAAEERLSWAQRAAALEQFYERLLS